MRYLIDYRKSNAGDLQAQQRTNLVWHAPWLLHTHFNFLGALTIFILISFSTPVFAGLKYFEADIHDANWQFEGNPLSCRLSHEIPYYGQAMFSKSAGSKQQLGFSLSYLRHQQLPTKTASVHAIAPTWRPDIPSRELGEIKITPGPFIFENRATSSWRLLYELESGRYPTFSYQDLNQQDAQVSVALSSVRFKPAYEKFLGCMAQLINFDLEQVSRLTLYFDFDRFTIRKNYQEKLQALAAYVKYDPSIEVVIISAHTDSKGSRSYNFKLSENRANAVKKILQLEGVTDDRFKLLANGELKPAATNRSKKGRALNRRVYIRIAQQ
ncbi:flagellar protein MotY [Aliikangiella maris]|uniref:OmpA family protein n=2 Tax=Aliikangiella maris TaxID=3162458 RepID=A0ABV2BZB0_9GAMM